MKTNRIAQVRLLAKNMAAACLLASILLLSVPGVHAQTAVQAWVQRHSHAVDSSDYAQQVVADNAGNVIVVGYTDEGITARDFLTIKYSALQQPNTDRKSVV